MFTSLRRLLNRLSCPPRPVRRPRNRPIALERLEDRLTPTVAVWTGAGAAPSLAHPNDDWSNPLNWQAQAVARQRLRNPVQRAPAYAKTSNNDLSGLSLDDIQFQAGGYTVTGDAIQLQNGIHDFNGPNSVGLAITMTAAQTFTADPGSTLVLGGCLNNGGFLVTVNANGNVICDGPRISGSGGLSMVGNSKFFLEDQLPDAYTGVTTVDSGTMYLKGAEGNAIVGAVVVGDGVGSNESDVLREGASNQIADASAVSIAWTGLLDLNGFDDTIGPLTMSGGNVTTGTGVLTLGGDVTTLASSHTAIIADNLCLGSGNGTRTFNVASGSTNGPDLNVTAVVSGGAGVELVKAGAGVMQLTGGNTCAGPTVLAAGTLVVTNADALGSPAPTFAGGATVEAGATLALKGGVAMDARDYLTLNGQGVGGLGALQDAGGKDSWNGPIDLATTSAIGAEPGTILTVNGDISGPSTSNLLIVGGGTVVLAGDNTYYEGYTRVLAGVLALDSATALGGAPYNGGAGTTVESGATLQLWALPPDTAYTIEPLILNGTGVNGAGALENLTGDNTWAGPVRLNSDATISCVAGSSLTDNVQVMNEGYTLTVDAVGSIDFATVISGAGGLISNGTGLLTFSSGAPNLYAGTTVVNAGTLMLSKPAAVQSLEGAGLVISAGATVAGAGTIDCDVTVNAGGLLETAGVIDGDVTNAGLIDPAGLNAVGTLTINGNYTQQNGGELDIEIQSAKAIDEVMISGVATLAGKLKVRYLDGFTPKAGDQFEFLTYGSHQGEFTTLDLPADLSLIYYPQDAVLEAH